ncbi:MAG TPA: hypothetical protein VHS78_15525 [Candidatus Elarobacter sp.]|jgi:hypothetical protein|nr:hypothetical protein [Candidatus Elarobacter sp.]
MYYVELLRARRVLMWYTIIVFGIIAIVALSTMGQHGSLGAADTIPLSDIFLGCAFGGYVVATIVSTSLVSESATVPITWTRPVSRERIAWSFIAVDVATILAGYLVMIAAVLLCIAVIGLSGYLRAGAATWELLLLGFGSAVLWYALTLAASSRLGGHGVRVATLSWLVFLVIGSVWGAPVPAPIHALLTALNYLNPIAYLGGISGATHTHTGGHPIVLSQTPRTLLAWALAAVAAFVAVRLWSTKEA